MSCSKLDLPPWTLATVPGSVRVPAAGHDSLLETPMNCWTADLRSIVPVQERGWTPDDYFLDQTCFLLKTHLLSQVLAAPLFLREHSMTARG